VTFVAPDGSWPIVWERAKGNFVWDADGRKYLDLTAAFGVAAAGHANPRVVKAGQSQMAKLVHAMGDVHPHALKAKLARELSRITFERWGSPDNGREGRHGNSEWGKTIFCNSGFEAVEAALKTVLLATGKPGVIAFHGAYHGLGYGALNATHRQFFRKPFLPQLRRFARFVAFPTANDELRVVEDSINTLLAQNAIGAILVEPVQTRGGINIPPARFLPMLRRICDKHHVLLVLDEIYTGFGRTGKWFACEHSGVAPDIICVGKALTGGFPLSACVGRAALMDEAWPASNGEAIHTSTFLGHPVGCAMALAQIREIDERGLVMRAADLGAALLDALAQLTAPEGLTLTPRGAGLLVGLELTLAGGQPATQAALELIKRLLRKGFVLLPEGECSNVIAFTPPLTIAKGQLENVLSVLKNLLDCLELGLRQPQSSTGNRPYSASDRLSRSER
jgi:4-aminobutyrate aminotransferase-like enzyme